MEQQQLCTMLCKGWDGVGAGMGWGWWRGRGWDGGGGASAAMKLVSASYPNHYYAMLTLHTINCEGGLLISII